MAINVSTAQELGEAVARGESRIVVTGSLGPAVMTIEAVGPVAWGIAIGAIAVLIIGLIIAGGTGGVGAPAGVVMEGLATPFLLSTFGSIGTITTAVSIALAGGGVDTLTALRRYRTEHENGQVVLYRQ